tara:strand:+ start:946 stop:1560 length:615 start_codon:yes stop_codon:yes gene_type:complete
MYNLFIWLDYFKDFLFTPLGIILFLIFYILWVNFLLPGSWLSIAAGYFYGVYFGSIIVFLGAFIGAEISFYLTRRFLRNWALEKIDKLSKLKTVVNAVNNGGIKFIILTRLSPAFPFSLLNLSYGITSITLYDFSVGLLGILPGTILFCRLGSLSGDINLLKNVISGSKDIYQLILNLIGLISTIAVVFFISREAKKALKGFDS